MLSLFYHSWKESKAWLFSKHTFIPTEAIKKEKRCSSGLAVAQSSSPEQVTERQMAGSQILDQNYKADVLLWQERESTSHFNNGNMSDWLDGELHWLNREFALPEKLMCSLMIMYCMHFPYAPMWKLNTQGTIWSVWAKFLLTWHRVTQWIWPRALVFTVGNHH